MTAAIDSSTPLVVLVTAPSAIRYRALPIARTAGRLGIAVHAVQHGPLGPDARSRYLRSVQLVPQSAPPEEWVETLLRLGGSLGRAVLVPLDDAGAVLVDDHAELLATRFIFPQRPPGVGRLLASKRELHLLCERVGVPTPAAAFPAGVEEAVDQGRQLGFPVVAKRIDGWLPSADPRAPSVHIAADAEDLRAAVSGMRAPEGGNVMLQEYLPGTPSSVWMFNGYFDERSEPLVAFTGRKLRQHPPYSGVTSLGEAVANEQVAASMCRLLGAVGYRGIVDAGLRFDQRDGSYRVLDVNPRIGATFRLFTGTDGTDVLRALYLDITGQPVPATQQRLGRRWIVEPLDVDSSLRYWRAGELSLGEWVRSLRRVQEGAWFASDDPLPALAVTVPLARLGARRVAEAARARASRLSAPREPSGDGLSVAAPAGLATSPASAPAAAPAAATRGERP